MDELIRKQDAIDAVNRALDRETLLNRLVRKVTIDAIRIVSPVRSDVPVINDGDMISRQAAMERLMNQNVILDGSEYHNGFNAGVNRAQEVIRNLPPVQPKRGYWTESHEHVYMGNVVKEWTNWYCSECDAPNDKPTDFCPNCGADMRGGVDG